MSSETHTSIPLLDLPDPSSEEALRLFPIKISYCGRVSCLVGLFFPCIYFCPIDTKMVSARVLFSELVDDDEYIIVDEPSKYKKQQQRPRPTRAGPRPTVLM